MVRPSSTQVHILGSPASNNIQATPFTVDYRSLLATLLHLLGIMGPPNRWAFHHYLASARQLSHQTEEQ